MDARSVHNCFEPRETPIRKAMADGGMADVLMKMYDPETIMGMSLIPKIKSCQTVIPAEPGEEET